MKMLPITMAAAAMAATPAVAQQQTLPATPANPIISLSVSESVDAKPDIATISTGVQTRGSTAQAAMTQNATQMDKLIAALAGAGIAKADIQTSGINLNPQYDYNNNGQGGGPRFIGYEASNQLTVKVRTIGRAGALIDKLVQAGATNINGPSFSIDNQEPLLQQARIKALKTAKARADFYAQQTGFGSARLVSLSESGAISPGPIPMMARALKAESDATNVEPGQVQVGITLSLQYVLVP